MQKNAKKASILIWSIFLSLIISMTFISISTRINKNIKQNQSIIWQIETQNETYNSIAEEKIQWNYEEKKLSNKDLIMFDSQNLASFWLKTHQKTQIRFPESSNITITLSHSWSVFYETSGNLTFSWVIQKNHTISGFSWTLNIENLWWHTPFTLESNDNFTRQYTNYKITKEIGNKTVIKTRGKIKNF